MMLFRTYQMFLRIIFIGSAVLSQYAFAQTQENSSQQQSGTYNEAYFLLERLNQGLAPADERINLQTPQAALEYFMLLCRQGDFSQAARALNLNLIPEKFQATAAPILAQEFFYVINQRLWINWAEIPDRPDGQVDMGGNSDPLVGVPRRSLRIGPIDFDSRDLAIRLQRVKVPDAEPVWVFSSSTVENIGPLYQAFGPGLIEKQLPSWASERSLLNIPLWQWLALVVLIFISSVCGWLFQKITSRLFQRSDSPFVSNLAHATSAPLAVIGGLLVFYILTLTILPLTGPAAKLLYPALTLLIVAMITWLGMRLIGFFADYFKNQYVNDMDSYENADIRHTLTYISV
jgi:hypothetical protein